MVTIYHLPNISAGIANFSLYLAVVTIQLIYPLVAENLGRDILFLLFAVISLIARALRSRSLRDGSLSYKGRFATFVRSC